MDNIDNQKYLEHYDALVEAVDEHQLRNDVLSLITSSPNPYAVCFLCIEDSFQKLNDGKRKTNTAVQVTIMKKQVEPLLKEFEEFLSVQNNKEIYSCYLVPDLQINVFKKFIISLIFNEQKERLIKIFSLDEIKEKLIKILLKQEINKETMSVYKYFDFKPYFDCEDVLIPLFLRESIEVVEDILKHCPDFQESFLHILDKIVGRKLVVSDLIHQYKVKKVNSESLKNKAIFKLGMRLLKKFNISPNLYPNIMIRQNMSSLRYLFQKYYIENGLNLDSLLLFAEERSQLDNSLKIEALDLFISYNDIPSAIKFLDLVKVDKKDIPHQIKSYSKSSSKFPNPSSQIENKSKVYYQLNMPLECICLVDSVKQFEDSLNHLSCCDVIGIDCEWKPSHIFNEDEILSLLQIASKTKVYLFDMINLPPLLHERHWEKLGSIFSDEHRVKLAYAFSGDSKHLVSFNKSLKGHLNTMENAIIDLNDVKFALMDSYPKIFDHKTVDCKGLSELVFLCFGQPLDKLEQCSFWSARPLSRSQILYAALDAFCLIEVYQYLNEKTEKMGISDWTRLKPQNENGAKKNSTTTDSNPTKNATGSSKNPQSSTCVKAANFRVACDTMLQGLGKLLRFCNVDTAILNSADEHDKCIDLFEKEKRIILTKGNIYQRLCKYIPESHIYCVKTSKPKAQLSELITHFQVIVRKDDVFARCSECNCNEYLYVDPALLVQTKEASQNSGRLNRSKKVKVGGGTINISTGLTGGNIPIQIEAVPYDVLHSVQVIYVCKKCGKCYWDGSHFDRFLSDIRPVVEYSQRRRP